MEGRCILKTPITAIVKVNNNIGVVDCKTNYVLSVCFHKPFIHSFKKRG